MEERAISEIVVGQRRREDLGDIDGLAANIRKRGLLHPIVIDDDGNLIAGHRRLESCRRLGWERVPVRPLGSLSDAERREIELEENLHRKDLTSYERSKTMMERVEVARKVAESAAVSHESYQEDSANNTWRNLRQVSTADQPTEEKRGPNRTSGSERDMEQRTGISRREQQRARQHVETADMYPVMQGAGWKRDHVLRARKALDLLPADERDHALAIAVAADEVPASVIRRLERMSKLPAIRRRTIITEAGSDLDKAIATLDGLSAPASRDRYVTLGEIVRLLEPTYLDYPDDIHSPRLRAATAEIRRVMDQMRANVA